MTFAHYGEFLVNTTTTGGQDASSITGLSDGRFVVTWTDASQYNTVFDEVRGQIFAADGSKIGGEFPVNTTTTNSQYESHVSSLTDGRLIVTWNDLSQSGADKSGLAVRAQILAADGTKSGPEFLVNATTFQDQEQSTVTSLPDGRFVVIWTDASTTGGDTSGTAIRGRIFTDANNIGVEFLVNTTTAGNQFQGSIAALNGGRFVVTWSDNSATNGDTSGYAVRGQIFAADGTRIGGEFLVNTTTAGNQSASQVTALTDGRFVVTWSDTSATNGDPSGYAVRGQIFAADGTRTGGEFLVNTTTTNDQYDSQVTGLADGRFVVTWTDSSLTPPDASGAAIRGQIFAADGSKSGGEFLVNTTTTSAQNSSQVAALADGRFVVSWTDLSATGADTSGSAVRAQVFDPTVYDGTAAADTVTGGSFDDRMNGYAGDDIFSGLGGDDYLNGGDGSDTLYGGDGNDKVFGAASGDLIYGGDGNDILDGGAGADQMYGGAGDDWYYVDLAGDFIGELPGGGNDLVWSSISYIIGANIEQTILTGFANIDCLGNSLANNILGNDGNNGLAGGDGNDVIFGQGGNDSIDGQAGADIMEGNAGNDTFFVDNAGDQVIEFAGEGTDTVWSTITYTLPAEVEILIANGAAAIDMGGNDVANLMLGNGAVNNISGQGGNDVILGQGGNDVIDGGAGNDLIAGGAGADILIGGTGNDYFTFTNINEAGDLITDFSVPVGVNQDILDLRSLFTTFTTGPGFGTTAATAIANGYLTVTQSGTDTAVYVDANGGAHNGTEQTLLALLQNTTASALLSTGNILVV